MRRVFPTLGVIASFWHVTLLVGVFVMFSFGGAELRLALRTEIGGIQLRTLLILVAALAIPWLVATSLLWMEMTRDLQTTNRKTPA